MQTALRYAATFVAIVIAALPPLPAWSAEVVIFDSDANGANGVTEAGGTFTWVPGTTATFFNGTTIDVVAGAGQIAQFGNGGTLGSTAVINVGTGSVSGLIIGTTVTSSYSITASSGAVLTLGGDGVVLNSGARATTIGSANLGFLLGSDQAWTSNSGNLLTINGAINLGDKTLTLAANAGGSITVNGALSGSGGLILGSTGAGVTRLLGANTYTGDTVLERGVLNLDFSNSGISTNLVNNGSVSSKLVLAGGTLTLTGKSGQTNSQAFNNTNVLTGASTITLAQNGATSLTVELGTLTRAAGSTGTLNFSVAPLASGVVATASATLTHGIIGPWATTGSGSGLSYATIDSGKVVAYTGATAADTPGGISATDGTANIDLANAAGTMPDGTSANTIRLTTTPNTTVLAGSLAVNSLINASSGGWTFSYGADRSLKTVTGDLIIHSANAFTISAPITDNGSTPTRLIYSGSGTLTLGGSTTINTFSGGLVINSGVVNTVNSSTTSVFGTGPITIMSGAVLRPVTPTATMIYDNAIIVLGTNGASTIGTSANTSTLTIKGGVTGEGNLLIANTANGFVAFTTNPINNSGTVTHANTFSGNTTISAVIGPNVTGLYQNATHANATLTLGGNNTFTSGVTINNGAIIVNHAGALNSANPNAVSFGSGANARLSLNGFSVTVSGLSSTATTPVVNNNHASTNSVLTVQAATGTSSSFAGLIQNGSTATLGLAKSGGGTWIYTGTGSYTGATNVNGGTLVFSGSGTIGNTAVAVGTGAAITANTGNAVLEIRGNITLGTSAGGSVVLQGGDGVSTGRGTLSLVGGAVNTLTFANPASASTKLTVGGASAPGLLGFEISSGLSADLIQFGTNGQVSVQAGGGLVNIVGLSGFTTGSYNLMSFAAGNASGLNLLALNSVPDGFDFALSSTATNLVLTVGAWSGAQNLVWNGGSGEWRSNQYVGAVPYQNGDQVTFNDSAGTSTVTIAAAGVAPDGVSVTNDSGNTYLFTGGGIGGGSGLTKSGSGTLILDNDNSYTGATAVNGGILELRGDNQSATIGIAGTLRLNSADAQTIAGQITGAGALIKTGLGTTTLQGISSFSGPTSVDGGTLVVAGSIDGATQVGATATLVVDGSVNALVTVAADGTLQGSGAAGGVVIEDGGMLAPGNSVATLEITGNGVAPGTDLLTLNGGARITFEFLDAKGEPGLTGWDFIDLATGGTLNLNNVNSSNKIELDVVSYLPNNTGPGAAANFNFTLPTTYQWLFIQADVLEGIDEAELNANYLNYFDINDDGVFAGGSPFGRPLGPGNVGATFSVAWLGSGPDGSGLYLQFTAVPEPGSMALAGLGSAAAAWYGRRRLRKASAAGTTG